MSTRKVDAEDEVVVLAPQTIGKSPAGPAITLLQAVAAGKTLNAATPRAAEPRVPLGTGWWNHRAGGGPARQEVEPYFGDPVLLAERKRVALAEAEEVAVERDKIEARVQKAREDALLRASRGGLETPDGVPAADVRFFGFVLEMDAALHDYAAKARRKQGS